RKAGRRVGLVKQSSRTKRDEPGRADPGGGPARRPARGICVTIPRTLDGRLQVCRLWLPAKAFLTCVSRAMLALAGLHKNELSGTTRSASSPSTERAVIGVNGRTTTSASPATRPELSSLSWTRNSGPTDDQRRHRGNFNRRCRQLTVGPGQRGGARRWPPIPQQQLLFWCASPYYEQTERIGDTFKAPYQQATVTIDGYTDAVLSSHRFCLGQLSNVHRSDVAERAGCHIGKGVQLSLVGDGDVWLRVPLRPRPCSSAPPSWTGRPAGVWRSGAQKIYPGTYIKCYSRDAHPRLSRPIAPPWPPRAATSTSSSFTSLPAGPRLQGAAVDELRRRLCQLRLSFVKGWGPTTRARLSGRRPAGLKWQLHLPLKLLDDLLQSHSALPAVTHPPGARAHRLQRAGDTRHFERLLRGSVGRRSASRPAGAAGQPVGDEAAHEMQQMQQLHEGHGAPAQVQAEQTSDLAHDVAQSVLLHEVRGDDAAELVQQAELRGVHVHLDAVEHRMVEGFHQRGRPGAGVGSWGLLQQRVNLLDVAQAVHRPAVLGLQLRQPGLDHHLHHGLDVALQGPLGPGHLDGVGSLLALAAAAAGVAPAAPRISSVRGSSAADHRKFGCRTSRQLGRAARLRSIWGVSTALDCMDSSLRHVRAYINAAGITDKTRGHQLAAGTPQERRLQLLVERERNRL
uniref:MH2 domain-containing protein n=1 Tax=Macrostomum lignano TaxID=282301 RepID=A0A1I8F8W2_9PLAT